MPTTNTKKPAPDQPTRAERPITRTRYAQLLKDVKALVTTASKAVDRQKVHAQWQLGKRITQERLNDKRGYHNSVLRDLAADIHVSTRTLQYAVKFHRIYPNRPRHNLSWSHYRVLLDRPDATRAHYEQLALSESLTSPELERRIAADQRATTEADSPLPRPTDANYLYRAEVVRILDGDTLELSIDLGFHVNRTGTFRLANIDTPELPTTAARLARDFVYERLLTAQTIVVKTQRTDLHGRYVTHLFYAQEQITTATCFTEGTYLNAELVEAGHAEIV